MADLLLNGREPVAWELPALARARACELERDMRVLAGVLTEEAIPHEVGALARPVTELLLEYS